MDWRTKQSTSIVHCLWENAALLPAKLQRYFTAKHSQLLNKDIYYFQRLLKINGKARTMFERKVTISNKAQEAI